METKKTNTKTITKPLGSITSDVNREALTVLALSEGKVIARIEHPRKVEWWLVSPAKGEDDCRALLIDKIKVQGRRDAYKSTNIKDVELRLLQRYSDRVTLIVEKGLRAWVSSDHFLAPAKLKDYRPLLSDGSTLSRELRNQ
jgi:hypothetical protein